MRFLVSVRRWPRLWSPALPIHFARDPISYALETDWPVGAGGFEPLHRGIELQLPPATLSRA
jgi:hypothetical protein